MFALGVRIWGYLPFRINFALSIVVDILLTQFLLILTTYMTLIPEHLITVRTIEVMGSQSNC